MKSAVKRKILVLLGFLYTSLPLPLWASSITPSIPENGHKLFYLVLSAVWIVFFILLAIYYRLYGSKFKNQAIKLKTEVEQFKNRIDFFHKHADQIKEEEIEKLHEDLGQLNISLKAMQVSLQTSYRSSKRNSILLSNISHTLRTNLNDILGFSSLLTNEFAMKEEEDLFEYSENIRKSSESLMHLLNNIIDISRIEANTFDLKPENCHLTVLTQEIIASYESLAEQKGIKLVFKDEGVPVFSGDGQSLRHILSNLIDNAIRFTENGFVKIQQKAEGNQLVWSIKDTGIGIDKAYLPDIFEPFRRHSLGYSKSAYQGAGLGLPLVKQLLELMKGHIELESRKAVGTAVTIYLPLNAPLPEETKTGKQGPFRAKGTKTKLNLTKPLNKLLIADSDHLNNMLIKKMLPDTKVIEYVSFEQELIQHLEKSIQQKQLYEVIILEINFEIPSGGRKWLKKMPQIFPQYKDVPIIALSSFPELNETINLLNEGFYAYVSKPVNREKLYNSLNQLVTS